MDVLKDVKEAESDAERIEQDFDTKAVELLASVTARLDERREELIGELDGELRQRAVELDRQFLAEREAIVAAGRAQCEMAEESARSCHDAALQLILKTLQR